MEHPTVPSPTMSSLTELQSQCHHITTPIDPELFQSPSCKRPHDDNHMANPSHDCSDDELSSTDASSRIHYTSMAATSSPAPLSSVLRHEKVKQESRDGSDQVAHGRRIEEGQFLMNQRFQPYKRRQAPAPLELCFAMRSLGRSSFTDINFEDFVQVSLTSSFPVLWHVK